MPVHPTEEEAPEGLYEKVAKNPSSNTDSSASDHKLHENEHTMATAQDHKSKGPVVVEDLPPAASTEELKARAAELNK